MLIPFGVFSAAGGGPQSYELIATATGTGSSGSISFSSLPTVYKHLQLRVVARTASGSTSGTDYMFFTINSDTGSNYAYHFLHGNGSSVSSTAGTSLTVGYSSVAAGNSSTTNAYAASVIDILDYQGAKNKTIRSLTGAHTASAQQIYLWSTLWMNTTAVTGFTLNSFENFAAGSRFSLYGVRG